MTSPSRSPNKRTQLEPKMEALNITDTKTVAVTIYVGNSMQGVWLNRVKAFLRDLIEDLPDGIRFIITTFAKEVELVVDNVREGITNIDEVLKTFESQFKPEVSERELYKATCDLGKRVVRYGSAAEQVLIIVTDGKENTQGQHTQGQEDAELLHPSLKNVLAEANSKTKVAVLHLSPRTESKLVENCNPGSTGVPQTRVYYNCIDYPEGADQRFKYALQATRRCVFHWLNVYHRSGFYLTYPASAMVGRVRL